MTYTPFSAQLQELHSDRDLKEKYPEDKPSDYALASLDFEAELERCILLTDHRFAQSIATAVETDAITLQQITAQEEQLCRDRDFALRSSGDETDDDITGPWELIGPPDRCKVEDEARTFQEHRLPSGDMLSSEFAGSSAPCLSVEQGTRGAGFAPVGLYNMYRKVSSTRCHTIVLSGHLL